MTNLPYNEPAVDAMAAPGKSYHFILNPSSGAGEVSEEVLEHMLQQTELSWQIYRTEKEADIGGMTMQAIDAGADVVVACGGDGTVSEVAQYLVGTDVALGILPIGTANVIASELCIPKNAEAAVALLAGPEKVFRKIDAGRIGEKYFLLRVGIGLQASMTLAADPSLKRRMGKWAYFLTALRLRREYRRSRYTVEIDGKTHQLKGVTCIICNSANVGIEGGDFVDDIDSSDGYLDVVVVRNAGLKTIYMLMRQVLISIVSIVRPLSQRESVLHWKGKDIKITSRPMQRVSRDGESFDVGNPVQAQAVPHALNVVAGAK